MHFVSSPKGVSLDGTSVLVCTIFPLWEKAKKRRTGTDKIMNNNVPNSVHISLSVTVVGLGK